MNDVPKLSVEQMQRVLAAELSLRSRVAHTALLLAALLVAAAVGSLWLTEPTLPTRTHIAFALIVTIALAWVAYALWVLAKRRVLLAGHRVIASRMAVAFTGVFFAGSLILALQGMRGAFSAAVMGASMLLIAITMLAHARRQFARLLARRQELETAARA